MLVSLSCAVAIKELRRGLSDAYEFRFKRLLEGHPYRHRGRTRRPRQHVPRTQGARVAMSRVTPTGTRAAHGSGVHDSYPGSWTSLGAAGGRLGPPACSLATGNY